MALRVSKWLSLALLVALGAMHGAANAQSLSVRPTILLDAQNADRGTFTPTLHLGVSGSTAELISGLSVGAELSLLIESANPKDTSLALLDNSSYLQLRWRPASWNEGEGLAFTLMPLHADRIYLGFEFPLADSLETIADSSPETGAELRLDRGRWYAVASLKSEMIESAKDHEAHRAYTALLGGGVDLLSALKLELEGARSDVGVNPEPQVLGQTVATWGVAARVMFHHGEPIGPQVDYQRYRKDPAVWEELLRPPSFGDPVSASVAGELLYLLQTGLASPDKYGATASASSLGYALDARLAWRRTRFFLRGQARSLMLLQADALGFPPFYVFPAAAQSGTEYRATLAVDHGFTRTHLTPGVELGISAPAYFIGTAFPGATTRTTVVVYDTNTLDIRPDDSHPDPTFLAKLTLRWDSERLSAIGDAFLQRDPNRTTFADNVLGTSVPQFDDPMTYGFDVLVQARF